MALYQVMKTSFINDKLVDPEKADGSPNYVEYDGEPGDNLQLVVGKQSKGTNASGTLLSEDDIEDASDLA